ncbi:MAG: hypothetical protein ACRDQX_05370 [Pseudonocardiaceae bacterium]
MIGAFLGTWELDFPAASKAPNESRKVVPISPHNERKKGRLRKPQGAERSTIVDAWRIISHTVQERANLCQSMISYQSKIQSMILAESRERIKTVRYHRTDRHIPFH